MMKKPIIWLFGECYDMNGLTLELLESSLQKKIDGMNTPEPFKIHVSDNEYEVENGFDEEWCYTFFLERSWNMPAFCNIRYEEEDMMPEKDAQLFMDGMYRGNVSAFLKEYANCESVKVDWFADELRDATTTAGATVPEFIEYSLGTKPHIGWAELILNYPEII